MDRAARSTLGFGVRRSQRCKSWEAPTSYWRPRQAAPRFGSLLPGLAVRGTLVLVEVSGDATPLNGVPLVFGGRSVVGSLTGRAIETRDTLDFCVLAEIHPMIETLPLLHVEEAYMRMMSG